MSVRPIVLAFSVFLVVVASCTTVRTRPSADNPDRIEGIFIGGDMGPRTRIDFGRVRGTLLTDSLLLVSGEIEEEYQEVASPYLAGSGNYEFPLDSIQAYLVRETKVGATIATTLVITAGVAAIAIAASSCPILYSYDGESYHPDAEPLGGATSAGLARSDLVELERIRPSAGRYRLAAVNEMKETQFVDALSLVVVDHPAGTRVLTDRVGELHLVSDPVAPQSATLQDGEDVRSILEQADGDVYSFDLEASLGREDLAPRDSLLLEFARPEGATSAKLVIGAGTTLWGAAMLRQMLELWGTEIDDWYRLLDGSAATRVAQEEWALREEHFVLKVWVEGREGWEAQEVIVGSGPIIPETQVVPLNLDGVDGDRVRVRLDPPRGFWMIDHVGMDFSAEGDISVYEIEAVAATDDQGGDVAPTLRDSDSSFVEMPEVGDRFTMEFPVPDADPGNPERTVFARTVGYYTIHTDRAGPRQAAMLDSLWLEPDFGAEFSFRTFADWQAGGGVGAPGVGELPGRRE